MRTELVYNCPNAIFRFMKACYKRFGAILDPRKSLALLYKKDVQNKQNRAVGTV